MASLTMETISGANAGRASSDSEISYDSDSSDETAIQLIEPAIKVNWTIHGGGSDGYYYRRDKWNNMQHDFVNVKDLFVHINTELGKISGKEGRTINSLKIFRWTSPGASIVSNIDIDDKFREIFEHPFWYRFYINKAYKSRACLGAKVPHKGQTVGSEDILERGPGELLKDLQLFMYKEGDENGDIFLNELLSTEYASKYTQITSNDFGLWMAREDGSYGSYRSSIPVFEQVIPDEWMPGKDSNQRKTALGNFHKDIFGVGGVGASLPDKKMTDVITEIIIKSSKIIDNEEEWDNFCQNWEFFPVTCSPMMGVEGRKELLKVEKRQGLKFDKNIDVLENNGNRIRYARLNANPGLWFVYLLNVAKRCWIFHTGKETRDKWQTAQNKENPSKKTNPYIEDMNPSKFIFEDSFDCLDPAERKQLYMDINGFCQNIRPNSKRQATRVFNDVPVYDSGGNETKLSYNLFDNGGLLKFMDMLSNPDVHTYLDNRTHLMSKIEKDWVEGDKLLDQILNYTDCKLNEIAPEYDATNVPFVLKILFYVIYNASHVEDGIAKDYGMVEQPPEYKFKGSQRTTEDDVKQTKINESMSKADWGYFSYYDFSDAINGFIKGIAGKLWNVHDDYGAQRMADGVATNIESSLRDKGPLPTGKYEEWQEGGKAYSYLQYACVRERNLDQEVRHQIMTIAPTLEPGTFQELSGKLKKQVEAEVRSLPKMNPRWFESTYTDMFNSFVKEDITKKTTRTKLAFNKDTNKFEKVQNGGKKRKKRRRKKRTRRKRKIKLKWSRKRKKPKKKIIRIKIKNKTTRNYIKVKKLAKKKRKKRTRRRRRRRKR